MAYHAFDLNGKVALITGGNGGIGLGFAEALAQAGSEVCIWGTNDEKNAAALEKLNAYGRKVVVMKCNVSNEEEVRTRFNETLQIFGRVDACFANAGVGGGRDRSFAEMETEEWKRVLDINLNGVFFPFREASRHMVERAKNGDPGGRLIGTASLAALSGAPRGEHYAASKGGMVSMIRGLAVEFARYGVTAHTILPGWIETAMTERHMNNEKFVSNVLPRIPQRRWGKPEDFGAIAVYIMSDASSYHTGDEFLIDGGYFLF
ncbi:MAG: SDR family oxidoreductase [SAR324 cluster bacterium]|nr:SDR family oxidoreductase [SAR324 cluster bacterium]